MTFLRETTASLEKLKTKFRTAWLVDYFFTVDEPAI